MHVDGYSVRREAVVEEVPRLRHDLAVQFVFGRMSRGFDHRQDARVIGRVVVADPQMQAGFSEGYRLQRGRREKGREHGASVPG